VDAEAAKMAGIIAKDQKGKKVEVIDSDDIYQSLLQLETMEYLIETRLALIEQESKNPLLLQNDLFDLKMMVISLLNLFDKAGSEKEVKIQKVTPKDIGFVTSDAQKIRYILVTIIRLAIHFAKPESSIITTAFRHNELFCFYATVSLETPVINFATGKFSFEPIKKNIPNNFHDGIKLAERYAEMMEGRLGLSKVGGGKGDDSMKFMAELSLYKK
jgi:light-regulated signal transduction histidine kinase (bacteriophytochrome)